MTDEKVDFVSVAWVEKAGEVVEGLASQHGEEGVNFSVCEIFTDAPEHVAESGIAAWYLYIEGKTVRWGLGEEPGTDVRIQADYETSLPSARLVYTPEIVAEMKKKAAENPPIADSGNVKGNMSLVPSYLSELHNVMAVLTV